MERKIAGRDVGLGIEGAVNFWKRPGVFDMTYSLVQVVGFLRCHCNIIVQRS